MNAPTTLRTGDIPRIQHDEAMAITAEENRRFLELIQTIDGDAWRLPTDCTRWDVRAVVVHVVAGAEAQASTVEFLRQLRAGRPLTADIGGVHWVDGFNEAGLRARAHLDAAELPGRWATMSTGALEARRRMPKAIRALPLLRLGPKTWKPLGYLYDIGFTRDVWMHRVDLSRALNRPFPATAAHDGRIVANIIAEWATTHAEPFTLKLSGPAGGTYIRTADSHGDPIEIDAIDCCRILSGRGTVFGVLQHPLFL